MAATTDHFPAEYFDKADRNDDAQFYVQPRKVVHIDEDAIAALTEQFRALIPPHATVLDLMSSWRSHLPADVPYARVIGLGMNAEEMRDNPALDRVVVQNLNHNPYLPFEDAAFDAAVCTVSVQYMQRPLEVFGEVARVLKPGGPFIVSFSNRCFPSKAVAVWAGTTDAHHLALVTRYFELAGGYTGITAWQKRGGPFGGDPLYLVYGYRQATTAAESHR
jgi:SAM-dependent methyltransferase